MTFTGQMTQPTIARWCHLLQNVRWPLATKLLMESEKVRLNNNDQRQPCDDVSSLQILVHGLCSVQWFGSCQCQRDRRLRTVDSAVSFRDCSRLSVLLWGHLPQRSLRIWEKYVAIEFITYGSDYIIVNAISQVNGKRQNCCARALKPLNSLTK